MIIFQVVWWFRFRAVCTTLFCHRSSGPIISEHVLFQRCAFLATRSFLNNWKNFRTSICSLLTEIDRFVSFSSLLTSYFGSWTIVLYLFSVRRFQCLPTVSCSLSWSYTFVLLPFPVISAWFLNIGTALRKIFIEVGGKDLSWKLRYLTVRYKMTHLIGPKINRHFVILCLPGTRL